VKRVQILVFDGAEELDFVGPFEVFGMARRTQPHSFAVSTVARRKGEVEAFHGLRVRPHQSFSNATQADIFLVPGGPGVRKARLDARTLSFVRAKAREAEVVGSICTGALLLAAAGLLDGKRATTHASAIDELGQTPKVSVVRRRFVVDGQIATSAGVTAGIDLALHLVSQYGGAPLSKRVAARMEYGAPGRGR
jgi:transcriptional regulator GlxA family with amidase domain